MTLWIYLMVILTTFVKPKFFLQFSEIDFSSKPVLTPRAIMGQWFNTHTYKKTLSDSVCDIQCYIQNIIQFCVARCRCVVSETDLRVGVFFSEHTKNFLESFVPLTRYIIHNTKILSKLFSFFLKLFTLNYHNTFIYTTHEHIVTHCILYINVLIIMYNIHYFMYKYTHYSRKNYSEIQSENRL